MAISGNGREYDITFACEDKLKTTTSQYMCVCLAATTTSIGGTAGLCGATNTASQNPTMSANYCIGVNQTFLSSSSDCCQVRLFGVSKVQCACTVTAGRFVQAYRGASLTRAGQIIPLNQDGGTCAGYGVTATAITVVVGRALESGITDSMIHIFVNPTLWDASLVGSIDSSL